MDRDVAKQSKPGASTAVESTSESVGKGTLSGRIGGDHAPSAPAKEPAAPGKSSTPEPAVGKNAALTITSATSAKAPAAGPTRTTVGVGEVVTFTGSEGGEWTHSGGKSLGDGGDNTTYRWGAPASPGSYTITLTVGDRKATKTIVVIAPNAINFKKVGTPAISSGQGVGMTLNMDIGPKTVSFGAVQVKEKAGGATGVWGYFAKKQAGGKNLSHEPRASWTFANEDNTLERPDEALFDDFDPPYEPGGMTWLIPNLWAHIEEGGEGTPFATVTQSMHIADNKGTSVITKGGQSASRATPPKPRT